MQLLRPEIELDGIIQALVLLLTIKDISLIVRMRL